MLISKFKWRWYCILAIEYIFIFILSLKTPLYADDLLETKLSLIKIIQLTWQDYCVGGNGRFFGQLIYRILDNVPLLIFAILNAAVFCLLTFLIFIISVKKHHSIKKYIILLALLIFNIPAFGQTVLWKAGAGNYLWLTTIILLYLIGNFSEELCNTKQTKRWAFYIMPFLSFIAGWGNENTSFAAIILSIFLMFYRQAILKKSFSIRKVINFVILVIGYLCLLFAPANQKRTSGQITIFNSSNQPYFAKVFNGCINVILTISHYYLGLLILTALMVIIMKTYYFSLSKTAISLFFIIAGGLAIMALVIAPIYTWDGGRAYFGGIIFLLIAVLTLLPDNLDYFLRIRKFLGEAIMLIICIGSIFYVNWGIHDWFQSSQAIYQRYEYINQQLQQGHTTVKIPPLSYYPKSKFSVNYGMPDISQKSGEYMDEYFYHYFSGLKKIKH
ncbi:DUF3329 domain-containing protein [Bombilactobacillus bombi]|uniref:DUF3329 domain-containing protein n=1 Tax=Bombilactobacillus bombi TaxID=1303590 RepID=UPI0015E60136|nr:DUF6056 family protein [Bombilactobacillus bombi]MBA1434292.1 hypothetical protein [Bombilactobacillus bombi]